MTVYNVFKSNRHSVGSAWIEFNTFEGSFSAFEKADQFVSDYVPATWRDRLFIEEARVDSELPTVSTSKMEGED